MKEYKTKHKHKCGCTTTIVTLGYKPSKKSIQKICPKCTLKELLKPNRIGEN